MPKKVGEIPNPQRSAGSDRDGLRTRGLFVNGNLCLAVHLELGCGKRIDWLAGQRVRQNWSGRVGRPQGAAGSKRRTGLPRLPNRSSLVEFRHRR